MQRRLILLMAAGWFATSVLAAGARAGTFNKVLSLGDEAPGWENLAGTDDAEHSLADYKDAELIVVVFTCNHCPIATAYEDRLISIDQDYSEKGVRLVAINCNNGEADRLPAMKERAEQKGFQFPYLYDPSQASGRAFGAMVTPDVFVLDRDRKVVYMGAVDDNFNSEDDVTKPYLRSALDALLAGKSPDVPETRAKGCGIMWDR